MLARRHEFATLQRGRPPPAEGVFPSSLSDKRRAAHAPAFGPQCSVRLDHLPYQVRLLVMHYLRRYIDRRWGSPQLAIPVAWAPIAQVLAAQFSDPDRVSFVGHLAGAVGAMVVLQQGIPWRQLTGHSRRSFPRHSLGPVRMRQALLSLICWLPLHVLVWWLGRRAVREATSSASSSAACSDLATDWPRALRSIWSDCTGARGPGRRFRTWGAGTWGGSGADKGLAASGFLGEQVRVVGLQYQPELNGLHGRILGVEEDTGRFIVRLQGVADNVSVRSHNLARLPRAGR